MNEQEAKAMADLSERFRSVSRKMHEFRKAMVTLGEAAKRANRDIVRATRRPSLIHKGGKP